MENDCIKREDAVARIADCHRGGIEAIKEDYSIDRFCEGLSDAIDAVNDAPAADVVPIGEEYECGYTDGQMAERKSIVHCKECKWHDNDEDFCHNPVWGDGHANYMPPITDKDNYCGYGERKEQEHE